MRRRRRRWSKKDEKEHERIGREIAESKAKARSESEDRQEKIKVLWGLDDQQLGAGAKNPKDRKLKEKELKSQKLKQLLKSVRDSTGDDDPIDQVRELVELVALQDCEIAYLTQFRQDWERIEAYAPEQVENLSFLSMLGWKPPLPSLQSLLPSLLAKQKPSAPYEDKRRRYNEDGIGEIERQFGSGDYLPSAIHPFGPHCLDDIFAGRRVHMWRLQQLFGINRNRFQSLKLPYFENGTEKLYNYRAVTKIMDALLAELAENPPEHKTPARGCPRQLWPSRPDRRRPVLSRIEARINSLSVPDQIKPHIKAKFLKVVRDHPPDSAKK